MKKSSIKINLIYQAFYEILIIVLPLLTSPYISRVLGAEKLGVFSYTYSIAYYFQLFGMLGLKFYGNRTIAQTRDDKKLLDKTYSEILVLHVFFSVISMSVYMIYAVGIAEYKLYAVLQGLMVLSTVFDVSWLFFGLENFKSVVRRNTVIKIASVALIFMFVHSKEDLWIYVLIMSGGQFLGQAIMFMMAPQYASFHIPKINTVKKHIKPLFVLFIPVIALSLFKYMDKIMLGMIGSKAQLGFYENSEKILNIPLSVILAFGSVMLPKISNLLANKNNNAVEKYMEMSFKYMMCLTIAMTFGMAGIANVFAPIFWGQEFNACGMIIQMLAISLPFSTIANIIRNQDLIPRGKDKYYSYAIICGALSNLIINWLLIPKYEAIGVTIGTIVSEILVCLIQLFLVRNEHDYFGLIRKYLFFLIPGILMYYVVIKIGTVLGTKVTTILVQIVIGASIYGAITLVYFIFTKDEEIIRLIKRIRKS